jgi:hypothetical protein
MNLPAEAQDRLFILIGELLAGRVAATKRTSST